MSRNGGHQGPGSEGPGGASIIRIPPHHYIHVLDQNTNIARVEIGPLTYIRQDNERSEAHILIGSSGSGGAGLTHILKFDRHIGG